MEDLIFKLVFLPLFEVAVELKRHNIEYQMDKAGQMITIRNVITGGFGAGHDPIGRAAVLGFVLCGPRWASQMPDLFPRIHKEWRDRSRIEKTNRKTSGTKFRSELQSEV